MWFKFPLVVAIALSFLLVSPLESWSQRLKDNHDCFKTRKGGYKCVKGPLAGKTFKSQQSMIRALTKGFGPLETKKTKVIKSKKRVKKAKHLKKSNKKYKKKAKKSRKRSRRR